MKIPKDAEHLLNTAGFGNIFKGSRQLAWSFTLLTLSFSNSVRSPVAEEPERPWGKVCAMVTESVVKLHSCAAGRYVSTPACRRSWNLASPCCPLLVR